MQHDKITVHSISDPAGTLAPLAGVNGELGRLALESQVNAVAATVASISGVSSVSINSTPASANNFLIEVEDYYAQIMSNGYIKFFKITPISVSLNGGGTYEIGQTVNTINLSWSYNNGNISPNVSQSINNGIGSLPLVDRSYAYTTPITSNITFTITAIDSVRGTTTNSTSVNFAKRVYYGVTPLSIVNSSDISGASSILQTSTDPDRDITYDCTGGRYFFYAYPKVWGLLNLSNTKVNGLSFSDFSDNSGGSQTSPFELTMTNIYGYTEAYYIYKCYNLQNGSSIPVQFRN